MYGAWARALCLNLTLLVPSRVRAANTFDSQECGSTDQITLLPRALSLSGTPVDIWAFGCVVYELLYGASLFGARSRRSEEEIEAQILSSDPIAFPPTTAAAKLISAAGTALIAVCFAFCTRVLERSGECGFSFANLARPTSACLAGCHS